jgi:hypothetical protein
MTLLWVARLMDRLRERARKRILFIGNGLSVAPWAFAHAGFTCVTLDISRAVDEFLSRNEMTEAHVRRAFSLRERSFASAFERSQREGGPPSATSDSLGSSRDPKSSRKADAC